MALPSTRPPMQSRWSSEVRMLNKVNNLRCLFQNHPYDIMINWCDWLYKLFISCWLDIKVVQIKEKNLWQTGKHTVEMALRIRRSWMRTMSKSEVWRHFEMSRDDDVHIPTLSLQESRLAWCCPTCWTKDRWCWVRRIVFATSIITRGASVLALSSSRPHRQSRWW